jgi:RNA polymerase sigma factor (sigma-70 family)
LGKERKRSDDQMVSERFTAAYRELSPRVLGYLRMHGVDDPESVTNEVFLGLYRSFPRGEGDDVSSLTFSIAHARLVDHYRSQARRPRLVEFDPNSDPRRAPSAEEMAQGTLGESGLLAHLTELGDEQREALSLRIIAGLSLEETARVMDKSVGAVKQLQRRALLSLRASITEEALDE